MGNRKETWKTGRNAGRKYLGRRKEIHGKLERPGKQERRGKVEKISLQPKKIFIKWEDNKKEKARKEPEKEGIYLITYSSKHFTIHKELSN